MFFLLLVGRIPFWFVRLIPRILFCSIFSFFSHQPAGPYLIPFLGVHSAFVFCSVPVVSVSRGCPKLSYTYIAGSALLGTTWLHASSVWRSGFIRGSTARGYGLWGRTTVPWSQRHVISGAFCATFDWFLSRCFELWCEVIESASELQVLCAIQPSHLRVGGAWRRAPQPTSAAACEASCGPKSKQRTRG